MLTRILIVAAALAMTGCATTNYTFNNQKYSSAPDALAALSKFQERTVSQISVVSPTNPGKALVLTPSKSTAESVGIVRTNSPPKEIVDYLGTFQERDFGYFAKYLEASKAFTGVEGQVVDFPQAVAKKKLADGYAAVVYLHMISPSQIGWYLLTPSTNDPLPVKPDSLAGPGAPRINSWISEIVKQVPSRH